MPAKPGGAVRGTFPSLKLNRAVRYMSSIERDFLFFVEFDPQVLSYAEQPLSICGTLPDGTPHQYTPDFLVRQRAMCELVECKPAQDLDEPHTRQQCWLGQTWAETQGYRFRVVTDVELRRGAELANLKLLWRYSRLPISPSQRREFDEALTKTNPLTVGQLALTPDQFSQVLALLFHHELHTDLSRPLDLDSLVWR